MSHLQTFQTCLKYTVWFCTKYSKTWKKRCGWFSQKRSLPTISVLKRFAIKFSNEGLTPTDRSSVSQQHCRRWKEKENNENKTEIDLPIKWQHTQAAHSDLWPPHALIKCHFSWTMQTFGFAYGKNRRDSQMYSVTDKLYQQYSVSFEELMKLETLQQCNNNNLALYLVVK